MLGSSFSSWNVHCPSCFYFDREQEEIGFRISNGRQIEAPYFVLLPQTQKAKKQTSQKEKERRKEEKSSRIQLKRIYLNKKPVNPDPIAAVVQINHVQGRLKPRSTPSLVKKNKHGLVVGHWLKFLKICQLLSFLCNWKPDKFYKKGKWAEKTADSGVRIVDLQSWKPLLWQLFHNHCPTMATCFP